MSIRTRRSQVQKNIQTVQEKGYQNTSPPKDVCRKRPKLSCQQEQNPYENIPEIPHVKLTVEEMNSDPIALLSKLQKQYASYGAVRLTTSDNWNCPLTFRYVDKGITTRIQKLQSLKTGKAFEQNVEAYNINSFQAFAKNFEHTYKLRTSPTGSTNQAKIQLQYWRLVTMPEYEKKQVKVEYAADLPSIRYGSGFPTSSNPNIKDSDFEYENNHFNLNNIRKSENSLLRIAQQRKQKISGITHPWVYMGMMFSTFCWHVEDLEVNSINYSHKGGVKTWYIVPGQYKNKFDDYVTKKYCQSSFKKTLLQRITFMVDPLELISAGIPVYKTYQRPRDYVCTFFRAYHCGFSQGYNVGEAINFLSPLSLPIMLQAREAKKNQYKPSPNVIPLEWLILENHNILDTFSNSHNKALITKSYNEMVKKEKQQLQEATKICDFTSLQIIPPNHKYDKVMCSQCKQYLYLEAYKLEDGKTYCIEHLKQMHTKLKEDPTKVNKHDQIKAKLLFREPRGDRVNLFKSVKITMVNNEEQNKVNVGQQ